ncbi:MAG: A24 family peptidase C-terminal domain-containing protein [Candidatus Thermoplasmatota archaeon]
MTNELMILNIIRFITGSLVLLYASYTDIKTRRAANYLWVIIGGVGTILLIIQYIMIGFDNIFMLIFIPLFIGLMYLLFQLRVIFGGADAKAFMALAILVPIQPVIASFPILDSGPITMPGSWIIFSNSVLLFLIIPISLLIYNTIKRNLQFPYCLLGYQTSVERARQTFVWPLEKIVDGKRKFSYKPQEEDIEEHLKKFDEQGIKTLWVTPKIPFMIPMLAGFITTFILGDLLSALIYSLV